MCSQDRVLEPASGFYRSELSECLLASQSTHASLFWNWLYSYQRQSQPSIVTPQRAERYDLHLALWLPESTSNRGQQGLMGQGWAAQHLLQCQGAWPALAEKCFYGKGRKKCFNLRAPREKTKLLAVNVWEVIGGNQSIRRDFGLQKICRLSTSIKKNGL